MRKRRDVEERFWEKVNKTDTCWLWTAAKYDAGYGIFYNEYNEKVLAHRWIWERKKGKIPKGYDIHHNPTCPKNCVNYESHLKPLSRSIHVTIEPPNKRVDNKCKRGHEMTLENTYINPTNGSTICKICIKMSKKSRDAYLLRRARKRLGITLPNAL